MIPEPLPAPPALRAVDEVDEVRHAIAGLVPCPPTEPLIRMVAALAARLEGHDRCAEIIHPAPGSVGVLEARERCLAVLDALTPAQRRAVVSALVEEVAR